MFHAIPAVLNARMQELEAIDKADRKNGTPRLQRLRQVSRETGQFLAILAAAAPTGSVIEIGTSAGYSALWLALGCAARGAAITTFEKLPDKAALARQTFQTSWHRRKRPSRRRRRPRPPVRLPGDRILLPGRREGRVCGMLRTGSTSARSGGPSGGGQCDQPPGCVGGLLTRCL